MDEVEKLFQTNETFRRIVEARALRLGMSEEALLQAARSESPRFLEAIRHDAARRGTTETDLLGKFVDDILESDYPGPHCLEPNEVEEFAELGVLPPDRLAHVDGCEMCKYLLANTEPSEERVSEFVEELRWLLPTAATRMVRRARELEPTRAREVSDKANRLLKAL